MLTTLSKLIKENKKMFNFLIEVNFCLYRKIKVLIAYYLGKVQQDLKHKAHCFWRKLTVSIFL